MARIPLGGKTVLNLATDLDPMFTEIYDGTFLNLLAAISLGNGTGTRQLSLNGGSGASDGSSIAFKRAGTNGFMIGDAGGILGSASGGTVSDGILLANGSTSIRMYTNGSERVRLDGNGNFGIGQSALAAKLDVFVAPATSGSAGMRLASASITSQLMLTGSSYSYAGVGANQLWLYAAGTQDINIGPDGAANVRMTTNGVARLVCTAAGPVQPGADNTQSFGVPGARWTVIYATTGSINTSDARDKTAVRSLNDAELEASIEMSREIGGYQWLSSIDEKGNAAARVHIGLTVQRAIAIMEAHGLDPMRYAFICHDSWDARIEPASIKPAVVEPRSEGTGVLGPDGAEIVRTWDEIIEPEQRIREEQVIPAGDRYGFRYDQLAMFILRGQAEQQRRLELRIAALETSA